MILLPHMKGKTVAVFGLGRTGLSVVQSLCKSGAQVLAWDDAEGARDALASETDLTAPASWRWDDIHVLVLSPGVPLTHPEPHPIVQAAQNANVPVVSDMELFIQALGEKGARAAPVIAVTGTNGKSTTVALIGHLLARAGFSPQVGGNIGKPVLDLKPPAHKRVYVLEVSSYQIDLTPSLAPDVGVLLNIAPDHLERHGGFEGYAAVKRHLFNNQQAEDTAIISVDDEPCATICAELKLAHMEHAGANVVPLMIGSNLGQGVYVTAGRLVDGNSDPAFEVADLAESSTLRGAHNWQNAAAAYAAARAVGAELGPISEALFSFPGLAHRQELVAALDGVLYVNDSKATNAQAAAKALSAFENIYWIAGGRAKEGGLEALEGGLSHVTKAYFIGEAAEAFSTALKEKVDCVIAETLDLAVSLASEDAAAAGTPGAVVLLSPACASFDQFTDFEARGEAFRAAVGHPALGAAAEGAQA
ncbi:UDP-N-acetylmuramoyl-L-alanine--D-glutamate ligase [bacterium AH-315-P15]|nr:UDP-N-acetylmuramoyl-L-alanine--D-glutamate ligase [bacterium AH-315-P15]